MGEENIEVGGKGEERFEREFLVLVESSWVRGHSEDKEFNELQKQLTN